MTYRVKEQDGRFYPQKRVFFMWCYFAGYKTIRGRPWWTEQWSTHTLEEALTMIEQDKSRYTKYHKVN